jgi:hypothetical protein
MSYDPFNWGEQLNPEKLNSKLEQINNLLSKAYVHNNELRKRVDTLNTAFELANSDLGGATIDGTSAYSETTLGASGYQIVIGAKHFSDNYGGNNVATEEISGTTADNFNLVLNSSSIISRIPLSPNMYGELEPSLGTTLLSSAIDFDQFKLWTILSPSTIWADKSASSGATVSIEVPETLTPLLNRIDIVPVTGTGYKLKYEDFAGTEVWADPDMSGNWHTGRNVYHINGSDFSGILNVNLQGTYVGGSYSYGLSHINMDFRNYISTGYSTIKFDAGYTGDKNLTYLNANFEDSTDLDNDFARIQISAAASGAAFDNNLIYDSDYHQYPLVTSSYPFLNQGSSYVDTIYIKVILNKKDNNTPVLKDLTIRYEEV